MGTIRNEIPARLVNLRGFMNYCGLGRDNSKKLGRDIGARVEIGGSVLYDLKKADAYFDRLADTSDKVNSK